MVVELLIHVAGGLSAFSETHNQFQTSCFYAYAACVCVCDRILTVGFSFLPWVAVVKDALCVVSPGQAAKFNPFQDVGQLAEVIGFHETHRYPVGAAAAQTVSEIFALFGQARHYTEEMEHKGQKLAPHVFNLPPVCL